MKSGLSIAVMAVVIFGIGHYIGGQSERAKYEILRAEAAEQTHERARNADIGTGDVSVDRAWLCEWLPNGCQ